MAQEFENLDLYVILGLEFGVDEKHVAKAYKKKSLLHHPDRGGDGKSTYQKNVYISSRANG
jgi:curved DNA-binding protein CbpA